MEIIEKILVITLLIGGLIFVIGLIFQDFKGFFTGATIILTTFVLLYITTTNKTEMEKNIKVKRYNFKE